MKGFDETGEEIKDIGEGLEKTEREHYVIKSKKVSNDIRWTVFLVTVGISIIVYLLNRIASPIGFKFPVDDMLNTLDAIDGGFDYQVPQMQFSTLGMIIVLITQMLSILMSAGVARSIMLHSRNIEEFKGFKNVFDGVKSNTVGQLLTSVVMFFFNILMIIIIFIAAMLVVLIGGVDNFGIFQIILWLLFLILLVAISSIVEMVGSSAIVRTSITGDGSIESIKKTFSQAKKGESIKEYIKISIVFFLKIVGLIIATVFVVSILGMINNGLSIALILLVVLFALYMAVKISVDFQILSNVFLGEYVLKDDLLSLYPEVKQSPYISTKNK